MKGPDVEQLLALLLKKQLLAPAQIPSEALFNLDVELAVKRFQKVNGLSETGKVDFRTLLLLKAQ